MLTIYTDGACATNPGRGGWAWLRIDTDGSIREQCGGESATTNNRMELRAVIEALNALDMPSSVTIRSDSRYVVDGISRWAATWQRRGWTTRAKEPVANRDLWEALIAAASRHRIEWCWVRGHNGDALNDRADALANAAAGGPIVAGNDPIAADAVATMPFGKHAGRRLDDPELPLGYLVWLATTRVRGGLRDAVADEIIRRQTARAQTFGWSTPKTVPAPARTPTDALPTDSATATSRTVASVSQPVPLLVDRTGNRRPAARRSL